MSIPSRLGTAALVLLLVSVSALTVVAALVAARLWIFPPGIEPVTLDPREQADLDRKIQPLREAAGIPGPAAEPYAELDAHNSRERDRIVYLTERELNAIVAKSPELADKVFFRLSEDMISASLLITFPEDFPVLAARTVRVGTGLRIGQKDGRALSWKGSA